MAAKEEAMAVENMEVGLDYWLPWCCMWLQVVSLASSICCCVLCCVVYK